MIEFSLLNRYSPGVGSAHGGVRETTTARSGQTGRGFTAQHSESPAPPARQRLAARAISIARGGSLRDVAADALEYVQQQPAS